MSGGRLTRSQITALEILEERDPEPIYPSNRNGPVGGSYAAQGSLWKLRELGLVEAIPFRGLDYTFRLTPAGADRLAEIRAEARRRLIETRPTPRRIRFELENGTLIAEFALAPGEQLADPGFIAVDAEGKPATMRIEGVEGGELTTVTFADDIRLIRR